MNARAKRIRAAAGDGAGVTLDAIARMIEFATSPASKKVKPDFADKLPISPAEFIERFKSEVGDKVLCDPILGSWYGRLGGILKGFDPKFQPEDFDCMIEWIKSGGLATFPGGAPTFENMMYLLPKWWTWSKQWDKNGRGVISKDKLVGEATGSDGLWSSFKPK